MIRYLPVAWLCVLACSSRPTPLASPPSLQPTGDLHFDVTAVDPAVDPCNDFYAYACGGWRRSHPIPPDRVRWSRYAELDAKNLADERALVEAAARTPSTPAEQRVGTYYAACLDQPAIEALGLTPLHELFAAIDGMQTIAAATDAIALLIRRGVSAPFSVDVPADPHDAHRTIAEIDLGTLGLDIDDYARNGDAAATLRTRYRSHVERVLRLVGESDTDATADADRVVALEAGLVRGLPAAAARRNPDAQTHLLSLAELAAHAPSIDWPRFWRNLGAPVDHTVGRVNATFVPYLEAVSAALAADLPAVRAYLRYHVARAFAELLPAALDAEVFDFTRRIARGAREMPPRWQRCLAWVDRDLGDDVGRMFVAHHFPAASRDRARAMVDRIAAALRRDLATLDWLGPAARKAAIAKLDHMFFAIGYSDRWKSYDGLDVRADDPVGNAERAATLSTRRELTKLSAPPARDEMFELPQRLDGYGTNSLVAVQFTAGFLQPPVFDAAMDDPVNFGGFGGVIGHEITHHFDDEGRKFDVDGNLSPWWSADDVAHYEQRAACFVDEYNQFHIDDGTPLDGKLTLGENLADNGGLRLAWDALQPATDGPKRDGFTPAQRFFLAWGQIRCENITPEAERAQVHGNGHSPGQFRVDGVVRNMPEFAAAFACHAGAPMAPAQRCRLW